MDFDIVAARQRLDEVMNQNDLNRREYGNTTVTEIQRERDAWQEFVNVVDAWHTVKNARNLRDLKADLDLTFSDHQLRTGINFAAERAVDEERGVRS